MALAREIPLPQTDRELEQLFLAHHARVIRAAYRVTGNMADAEDVAQAVFLRLAQRRHEMASESVESYLYRAAVNGALDVLRRRKVDNSTPIEDAVVEQPRHLSPERQVASIEMRDALRQALASLSPRAAEVFTLRYLADYSNSDIAAMLRTSQAVIAVMLHRARARLRNELRAYGRAQR